MKIVTGVDPDSTAHGIAIYKDGVLDQLDQLPLMDIIAFIEEMRRNPHIELLFSIENVMANQFMYARNTNDNPAIQSKMAMGVGRCQQAYVELVRVLIHYGVKYVTYKPSKSNWAKAKDKPTFERFTNWKKSSNVDTRSAAYFGYLALDKNIHDILPF
jgi:hypothetical protein